MSKCNLAESSPRPGRLLEYHVIALNQQLPTGGPGPLVSVRSENWRSLL